MQSPDGDEYKNLYKLLHSERRVLKKWGKRLKTQIKRYFSLDGDDCLIYFKDKKISRKARGLINLKGCSYTERTEKAPSGSSAKKSGPSQASCIEITGQAFKIVIYPEGQKEYEFFLRYLTWAGQDIGPKPPALQRGEYLQVKSAEKEKEKEKEKEREIEREREKEKEKEPSPIKNLLFTFHNNEEEHLEDLDSTPRCELNRYHSENQKHGPSVTEITSRRESFMNSDDKYCKTVEGHQLNSLVTKSNSFKKKNEKICKCDLSATCYICSYLKNFHEGSFLHLNKDEAYNRMSSNVIEENKVQDVLFAEIIDPFAVFDNECGENYEINDDDVKRKQKIRNLSVSQQVNRKERFESVEEEMISSFFGVDQGEIAQKAERENTLILEKSLSSEDDMPNIDDSSLSADVENEEQSTSMSHKREAMIKFLETSNQKLTHPSAFSRGGDSPYPKTSDSTVRGKKVLRPSPLEILEIRIPSSRSFDEGSKLNDDITKLEGSPIKKVSSLNKRNSLGLKFFFPKKESVLNLDELSKKTQTDLLKAVSKYIWEFEFNNALTIINALKNENFEISLLKLEIDLMKVIVSGRISFMETLLQEVNDKLSIVNHNTVTAPNNPPSRSTLNIPTVKNSSTNYDSSQSIKSWVSESKNSANNPKSSYSLSSVSADLIKSELYLLKGVILGMLNNKINSFVALKDSWMAFKRVRNFLKGKNVSETFEPEQLSRYHFISGSFNIGLSIMPNPCLKFLELIGVSPDVEKGLEHLRSCKELQGIREKYAHVLLCLYHTEMNPCFEKAFEIIKDCVAKYPGDPLFSWVGSLVSWRFLQGAESIYLLNKALWNCGDTYADTAFYLKFELGWFNISRLDWRTALIWFEDIAVVTLNCHTIDLEYLSKLISLQMSKGTFELGGKTIPAYPQFDNIIKRSGRDSVQGDRIIFPHKAFLALILATAYSCIDNIDMCKIWLGVVLYLIKKGVSSHAFDDDIKKFVSKFFRRRSFFMMKFEILYFLKEIVKVKEEFIEKILLDLESYLTKELKVTERANIILPQNSSLLVERSSAIFIKIICHCIRHEFDDVYKLGAELKEYKDYIPKEFQYLLHHSFHWVGRCLMIEKKEESSLEYLSLSKKLGKCEFSLVAKTSALIQEIKTLHV